MKASLIITTLNEEDSIKELLKSIVNQIKKPSEVIIVDGGSTDRTIEIIKKYSKKYKWIKLVIKKGASRREGRDIGVKLSKNKIIAFTDAGCILDKSWFKNITKPFERNKKIDVVYGTYRPLYTNDFEYFEGLVVVSDERKIFMNPSRMSIRSMAMKKCVWEKIPYPNIEPGDDTLYNIMILKNKLKIDFVKNAIVYWKMRKDWKSFAKQFYKYGIGDRKSGNIWRIKKNLALIVGFWIYIFSLITTAIFSIKTFLVLCLIPLLYFSVEGFRVAKKSRKIKGFFYGFLFSIVKRISYILGATIGI